MIITLMGKGKALGLPQVLPKDLEIGKYYLAVVKTMDDTGAEHHNHDMMFVGKGAIINPTTKQPTKHLWFLKSDHKCTLSQLGDPTQFFGPINVDVDLSEPAAKKAPKSAIGEHLDPGSETIGDYTWTNADSSVHKDQ